MRTNGPDTRKAVTKNYWTGPAVAAGAAGETI